MTWVSHYRRHDELRPDTTPPGYYWYRDVGGRMAVCRLDYVCGIGAETFIIGDDAESTPDMLIDLGPRIQEPS